MGNTLPPHPRLVILTVAFASVMVLGFVMYVGKSLRSMRGNERMKDTIIGLLLVAITFGGIFWGVSAGFDKTIFNPEIYDLKDEYGFKWDICNSVRENTTLFWVCVENNHMRNEELTNRQLFIDNQHKVDVWTYKFIRILITTLISIIATVMILGTIFDAYSDYRMKKDRGMFF